MPRCDSCGAEILFVRTAKGKLNPLSLATGRSHFEDCPDAAKWRGGANKLAAQTDQAERENSEQYPLPGFERSD